MNKKLIPLLAGAAMVLGAPAHGADLWRVYQLAQDSDPQLAAAAAAFRAAREAKPQSKAGLLPSVTGSIDWARVDPNIDEANQPTFTSTDPYNTSGYTLSVTQPLFRYGNWIAYQQADAVIAQAEANYGSARQGLALRVAGAYFAVLAARDTLEFAEAEKRATEQQLRQTEQRFEVGLSAITDVHEARAGYDAAVAQEIAARNQVDIARESLREITGMEFEALAPLEERIPLVNPEPTDIDAWVETAVDQNLQLLAAAAAAKAADQEVDRRQASHYPTVDVSASHAYTDSLNRELGTRGSENRLMLNLSVPLYQGGLISSQVREATHLYDQARELLEERRRATVRETRQAYLNVTAGISQVKAREQAVASAQKALEATQAGFEVGTRTAVDVLNSQRELFRAKRDYAQSRYDYILSTLSLKQAAGTLSADDIRAVNGWLR